jgi:hypothetical protein
MQHDQPLVPRAHVTGDEIVVTSDAGFRAAQDSFRTRNPFYFVAKCPNTEKILAGQDSTHSARPLRVAGSSPIKSE